MHKKRLFLRLFVLFDNRLFYFLPLQGGELRPYILHFISISVKDMQYRRMLYVNVSQFNINNQLSRKSTRHTVSSSHGQLVTIIWAMTS